MKNCFIIQPDPQAPYKVGIADLTQLGEFLPGSHTITRINIPEVFRGQGFGTKLLQQILDEADKEQVILSLEILPSGPLDYEQLRDWYFRHGFYELRSIPGVYCRNPKENS